MTGAGDQGIVCQRISFHLPPLPNQARDIASRAGDAKLFPPRRTVVDKQAAWRLVSGGERGFPVTPPRARTLALLAHYPLPTRLLLPDLVFDLAFLETSKVETIATSIASTLSASSAASSSALAGDGLASREGQHYPFLSFEEGGNVNKQDDDDADAASAGSGPSPSQDKGEISTAGGRAAEGSSGGSGGGKKDGPSEDRRKAKKRGSSGADGGDGIPSPETEVPADGGGNDSGGGGSGGGKADADGGSASG